MTTPPQAAPSEADERTREAWLNTLPPTVQRNIRESMARGESLTADAFLAGMHTARAQAAAPAGAQPVEMSPEFTDTSRAALLWVLWHHQGGSSPIGQPLRFALGMGAHDRLSEHQVAEAKRWAAITKSTTAEFHAARAAPPPVAAPAAQPARANDDGAFSRLADVVAKGLGYARLWEAPQEPGTFIVEKPATSGFLTAMLLEDALAAAVQTQRQEDAK